jgi:hypothetical protein
MGGYQARMLAGVQRFKVYFAIYLHITQTKFTDLALLLKVAVSAVFPAAQP